MDKIKKTNMNKFQKLVNSLQEMKTPGLNNISRGSLG